MATILVKADTEKNRLYITLSGKIILQDADTIHKFIRTEVDKLQPGFTVMNNCLDLEPVDVKVQMEMIKAVKYIINGKPSKIARIAKPLISLMFFRISSLLGYKVKVFSSIVEAEKYLNGEIPVPARSQFLSSRTQDTQYSSNIAV